MFDELHKYKINGHFFFKKGDSVDQVGKNVPELPGMYYVIRLAKGRVELVYTGKSGIITPGGPKTSLLKQTLIGQQDFFDSKMSKGEIDALDIYWFVTMDANHIDLPAYVEGLILQTIYDVHGRLPEWHK